MTAGHLAPPPASASPPPPSPPAPPPPPPPAPSAAPLSHLPASQPHERHHHPRAQARDDQQQQQQQQQQPQQAQLQPSPPTSPNCPAAPDSPTALQLPLTSTAPPSPSSSPPSPPSPAAQPAKPPYPPSSSSSSSPPSPRSRSTPRRPRARTPSTMHVAERNFQSVLSFILTLCMGGCFSVGSFTVPVEAAASPPGALRGAWPGAYFLVCLFYSPVSVVVGLMLSDAHRSARTALARRLSYVCAAAFAAFALSALGVAWSSRLLVVAGLFPLAFPLGIYTVLTVEHLLQWLPHAPSWAALLAATAFNAGMFLFEAVFDVFCHHLPVVHAIIASSALLTITVVAATAFMRFPDDEPVAAAAATTGDQDEDESAAPDGAVVVVDDDDYAQSSTTGDNNNNNNNTMYQFPKLTWRDLLSKPTFWIFTFVVLTISGSYAPIPYFFTLGRTFRQPGEVVTGWFQVGSVLSAAGCLLVPWLTDVARTKRGPLRFGARNVSFALTALQLAFSVALLGLSKPEEFGLFATGAAVFKMLQVAVFGVAAVLAVEMFGPNNSALVFGVGGGMTFGTGQAISVALMGSTLSDVAPDADPATAIGAYWLFYAVLSVWSVLCMVSILFMRRNVVPITPASTSYS